LDKESGDTSVLPDLWLSFRGEKLREVVLEINDAGIESGG
jgi:hypothetical protein